MSRRVVRQSGPPATRPIPTPPPAALRGHEGPAAPQDAAGEKAAAPNRRRRRHRRGRRRNQVPQTAIVFVGPMAAGKTSLGRRVAKELGVPFVDTDVVFSRSHGAITTFFEKHGEAEFRRIEAEIIAQALEEPGTRIVSLGGGAVLSETTRELLGRHPVVLLMTTERAVLRTANLSRRPLLRHDPGAWSRILEERRPLYEEVANVTFRTDRATKEQLALRVTQWVRAQGRKQQALQNAAQNTSPDSDTDLKEPSEA